MWNTSFVLGLNCPGSIIYSIHNIPVESLSLPRCPQNCLLKCRCEKDPLHIFQELFPGERTWPQKCNLQGQLGTDTEEPICSFRGKSHRKATKNSELCICTQLSLSFSSRYISKIWPYFEPLKPSPKPGLPTSFYFKTRSNFWLMCFWCWFNDKKMRWHMSSPT